MKQFKHWLLTGLFVWIPIGLTIWIIKLLLHTFDTLIPHTLGIKNFIVFNIPGVGLLCVLAILILTGIATSNMFGKRVIKIGDKLIMQIPIVKSIYKGIKQVSDTLLSNNGNAFRQALLVKFPHSDAWTIAFITGQPSKHIIQQCQQNNYQTTQYHDTIKSHDNNTNSNNTNYESERDINNEYINVYVPTTPNPTSGYFIIVNKKDTKALNITVDEALKYIISMGTVDPHTTSNI